jgi:hypothetical protein
MSCNYLFKLKEFSSEARTEKRIGPAARLIYKRSDWRQPFQVKSSNFEIRVNKRTFPSHIRIVSDLFNNGSCHCVQVKKIQFLLYGRSIGSWMSYTQDVYMSHGTEYVFSINGG